MHLGDEALLEDLIEFFGGFGTVYGLLDGGEEGLPRRRLARILKLLSLSFKQIISLLLFARYDLLFNFETALETALPEVVRLIVNIHFI